MRSTIKHMETQLIRFDLTEVFVNRQKIISCEHGVNISTVSAKFSCVYLCFSSGDLFIFSLRVSLFLFQFFNQKHIMRTYRIEVYPEGVVQFSMVSNSILTDNYRWIIVLILYPVKQLSEAPRHNLQFFQLSVYLT